MADSPASTDAVAAPRASRWLQLVLGLICMIVISSPQYVWTLFTQPMMDDARGDAGEHPGDVLDPDRGADVSVSRRRGFSSIDSARGVLLSIGAVLTGLSWMLAAQGDDSDGALSDATGCWAESAPASSTSGSSGHMVQWFPDKRGLATGLVAAGYGIGAILTTFPIAGDDASVELSAGAVAVRRRSSRSSGFSRRRA